MCGCGGGGCGGVLFVCVGCLFGFLLLFVSFLLLVSLLLSLIIPYILFISGVLACLDGYMNIALEQTEEYVNGQLKNKYGDAFIRGNNGE